MKPKITIALATFNSSDYTKFFLKNLKKNVQTPYELIIVDNNSTDGTKEFLSNLKDTKVILNKRNLGFGPANNQAFSKCKTEYFMGVNNDTVIFPGFIEHMLNFMDTHPKYGELGCHSNCIGAKNPITKRGINKEIEDLQKTTLSVFEAFDKYFPDQNKFYNDFMNKNPRIQNIVVPPNFIGGWCFLVRTKDTKKIGKLFDKRFKIGFWEDVDLSWRIANTGLKIGLLQGAYIHHFNHSSFNASKDKLPKSDHAISKQNGLLFVEKWSDTIKQVLKKYFDDGKNLKQIMTKNFIFKVYFRKANKEIPEFEKKLKENFVYKLGVSVKDFLTIIKR